MVHIGMRIPFFEVIFVLWAEMSIWEEFLKYFKITDPTFMIHPDKPKGGQFVKWLWSESEVRGWCNAALWGVPWFAHVYWDRELVEKDMAYSCEFTLNTIRWESAM